MKIGCVLDFLNILLCLTDKGLVLFLFKHNGVNRLKANDTVKRGLITIEHVSKLYTWEWIIVVVYCAKLFTLTFYRSNTDSVVYNDVEWNSSTMFNITFLCIFSRAVFMFVWGQYSDVVNMLRGPIESIIWCPVINSEVTLSYHNIDSKHYLIL
jgi:hypothetical protein